MIYAYISLTTSLPSATPTSLHPTRSPHYEHILDVLENERDEDLALSTTHQTYSEPDYRIP